MGTVCHLMRTFRLPPNLSNTTTADLAQFLTSTKPAAERMMVAVKHRGVRRGERDQ
jgi:hypothetical protein